MQSLMPYYIASYNAGLEEDVKPFLMMDTAFQTLENAYVWRERVKKREGNQLVGRLRRCFTVAVTLSTQANGASYNNPDILADASFALRASEPDAIIEPGSLVVTVGAIIFNEASPPNGTLSDGGTNTGTINYVTGELNLSFVPALGVATNVDVEFCYFPMLPVMGISFYEIAGINSEQTIFFDTKYAYNYVNEEFQELVAGTTWTGTDNDFFWTTNYRGLNPNDRLFFATNFFIGDPIRYFNGATWTNFVPYLSRATPPNPAVDVQLFQARIIIPYYGRLLALNTYEGTEAGGAAASTNFFNRCRFSQIGDPVDLINSWRSDVFGRGGFIDAPTNETIVSAIFFKNTLIVFFESTTWQLRYVGEYGLPFLWERISSDFGSESTFSTILFDQGVLGVGNRAIITSNAVTVDRIDLKIPDKVYEFKNTDNAHRRVHGIRNFQKELVYWCYVDSNLNGKFPNFSLLFNYRNNTYAIFRNNVTAFGYLGSPSGDLWDSFDIYWDSDTRWDGFIQNEFQDIVSGNQQGYIHFYAYPSSETIADSNVNASDQESLSITAIDLTVSPIQLTIPNHNLEDGEIIYLTGIMFIDSVTMLPLSTNLNNNFYSVQRDDDDNIFIFKWDFILQQYVSNFLFTPTSANAEYIGVGEVTLFPKLNIITKDFNPFGPKGLQCKMAYADFLTDATPSSALTIQLFSNTSQNAIGNLIVGQKQLENYTFPNVINGTIINITQANPAAVTTQDPHNLTTGDEISINYVNGMEEVNNDDFVITVTGANSFTLDGIDSSAFTAYTSSGTWTKKTTDFYIAQGTNYNWHRFYAGVQGNFFSINLTYDDNLMNQITTHQQDFVLNAICLYLRQGGRNVF